MSKKEPLYYGEYLGLDKILTAQHPVSGQVWPEAAHDETLFIIVHQAFELWFLQIRHELKSIVNYLHKDIIDDNSEEMARIVQRLDRIVRILKLANTQFEVLDTMQPLDFLEFRALLNPSSGFQSKQFRLLEAGLGLQIGQRHMPEHYKSTGTHHGGFKPEDYAEISAAEKAPNLLSGVKKWLSRMPFFDSELWSDYQLIFSSQAIGTNKFISDYFYLYAKAQETIRDTTVNNPHILESIKEKAEADCIAATEMFKMLFISKGTDSFTANELSAALFIMLHRHYPMLRLPFQLINSLIEIDELLSTWRYKHYLNVKKMIGTRPGTGGSPGAAYLLGALQKNNVYSDLTFLATYFIERDKLPKLPNAVVQNLNFGY